MKQDVITAAVGAAGAIAYMAMFGRRSLLDRVVERWALPAIRRESERTVEKTGLFDMFSSGHEHVNSLMRGLPAHLRPSGWAELCVRWPDVEARYGAEVAARVIADEFDHGMHVFKWSLDDVADLVEFSGPIEDVTAKATIVNAVEEWLEETERHTPIDDAEANDDEMRAAVLDATGIPYQSWPHTRLLLAIAERVDGSIAARSVEVMMAKDDFDAVRDYASTRLPPTEVELYSPQQALSVWLTRWANRSRAGTDDAVRWLLDDVERERDDGQADEKQEPMK